VTPGGNRTADFPTLTMDVSYSKRDGDSFDTWVAGLRKLETPDDPFMGDATEEELRKLWDETEASTRKPAEMFKPTLLPESFKMFKDKARDLRKQYVDITEDQIVNELQARCGKHRNDPGIIQQLRELVKESKRETFSGRAGKRRATRVAPLSVSRVQLRFYPDYFLDENGQVYDAAGMLVKPRWRNQRHWIRIYDHEGKRVERNVFWLMVGAGFIPDPLGRTTQEVSEATAKGKG
jgi:hypothetical protein